MVSETKNPALKALITVIAVGMSLYHLNIAWTGGYEFVFQRSLSFLFGVILVLLVYRHEEKTILGKLGTGALCVLTVFALGYPAIATDYFNSRLYYVDPLKVEDYVLGSIAIILALEVARRTINTALPLIVIFFLFSTFL